jgi:hypothetical protein
VGPASARPIRVLRPIRPHVGTDMPASLAAHPGAKGARHEIVGEELAIDRAGMAAIDRTAVDERAHDAVAAEMAHGHPLESLARALGIHGCSHLAMCLLPLEAPHRAKSLFEVENSGVEPSYGRVPKKS